MSLINKCRELLKKRIKTILLTCRYLRHLQLIKHRNKPKFLIFITPNHQNVGDLAILEAEKEFVKKYFPDYEVECFDNDESLVLDKTILKYIDDEDIISVHGGGFIGTIWFGEELYFRKIIDIFHDKRIIVFPQTIYFENSDFGVEELKKSKKIYKSNRHLIICAREEISYTFAKTNFESTTTYLIPDMVLSLNDFFARENGQHIKKVALCLRSDTEKTIEYKDYLVECLRGLSLEYDPIDMVIEGKYKGNSREIVYTKIMEISKYSLLVTDRLHGMVLSYLAGTPCIVLPSKSYKIKGVYNWIKDCSSICYLDNISEIKSSISKMVNINEPGEIIDLNDYYNYLAQVIKNE